MISTNYPPNAITQPISKGQIAERLQSSEAHLVDVPVRPLDSTEHTVFEEVTAPMAAEFEQQLGVDALRSWLKPGQVKQESQRAERGPSFATLLALGRSAMGAVGSVRGKLGSFLSRGSQSPAPIGAQSEADEIQTTILPVDSEVKPTTAITISNTANLQFEPPHSIAIARTMSHEVPTAFTYREPGDVYSREKIGDLVFKGAILPPARQTTENFDTEV